jgi:molybdopterin molybdotransferase
VRAGDVVVRRGAFLRPIEIAILAEAGSSLVAVYPRPRAAILATGNELVPVETRPAAGQIRNSNSPLLVAAANANGAEAIDLAIARDEQEDLRKRIQQGLAADLLVLSGGVSAGKFDLVPHVLSELGVQQVFHKVSLRPGRPIWFGIRNEGQSRTLVFGLPGNPVSSCVCFELFVRPAIAALAGRGFVAAVPRTARLSRAFPYKGGRESCLPARLAEPADGHTTPTVEVLPWHGSADLAALAQANALVRLGAEAAQLDVGATVEVICL